MPRRVDLSAEAADQEALNDHVEMRLQRADNFETMDQYLGQLPVSLFSSVDQYSGKLLQIQDFLRLLRKDQEFSMYDQETHELTAMPTVNEFIAFLEAKKQQNPSIRSGVVGGVSISAEKVCAPLQA